MKQVVLLCDGMADMPCDSLGGKTPMEAAHKPAMDALARTAEVGLARTVPDGMAPGSDVANLSVLWESPQEDYTGRSLCGLDGNEVLYRPVAARGRQPRHSACRPGCGDAL